LPAQAEEASPFSFSGTLAPSSMADARVSATRNKSAGDVVLLLALLRFWLAQSNDLA